MTIHDDNRHVLPSGAQELALHDPLAASFPLTLEGRILFWLAVLFSAFQIATSAHILDLTSQVVRAVHVGFLCLLTFPLVAIAQRRDILVKTLFWALGIMGFAVGLYQWIEYVPLTLRSGDPSQLDLVVGVLSLGVLFAASHVLMGPSLGLMCGGFMLYCLYGQYLPSPLNHRGYDFAQVIEQMAYGTEGIYGVPTYVSSSYIFLFILFGAFLEKAGMIGLFNDVSLGLVGHLRGGPAKVAVVSSGMMGTISGSGVANVVTVGQFTIPLMKRFGYSAAFAGGVESTASMGGQIMPPVMGAVAFIMAETLGVEYAVIAKAAVIPALLYYASAFWMVHLEAGKRGLAGLPKDQLPSARKSFMNNWHLVLPLFVLIYLLFHGYTPLYAGTVGMALTVMLILGGSAVLNLPAGAMRVIFWIGLGLVAGAFFKFGIGVVLGVLAILIGWNALTKGGRETLIMCRDSLADGAKTALPVGVACAIVGIIIGAMTLTGAANSLGQFIVSVGGHSLFLSLILTMITCIILGTGIPTIPSYIITAAIAGPALKALGVPLLISHMFVFYFGILADLTPPVALACMAAAPIARESGNVIAMEAMKIAAAGFVVPFMTVYAPELMLLPGPMTEQIGYYPAVLYILVKAGFSIGLWGAAVIGYVNAPLTVLERVLALLAAALLVAALPMTDLIGFALSAVVIAMVFLRTRRAVAA